MNKTFYFRSGAGLACGPGARYALSEELLGSAATIAIETEQTWNISEARIFLNAPWSAQLSIAIGGGGGAQNRVTLNIEKRNAACGTLQTILSVQSGNISAGATSNVSFSGPAINAQFAAGDILLARVVRSNGGRTTGLLVNTSNSFITAPDIAGIGPKIKYWNGAAWPEGELKIWTGAEWNGANLKRWNGTTWVGV